jgi:uncharacterized repeat protein (TIGR01451 family)
MPHFSLSRRPLARKNSNPLRLRTLGAETLEDRRMLALTTADMSSGITPLELVQQLVGGGVEVTAVQFTGSNLGGGRFSGGLAEGLGFESGIILGSGEIVDSAGPNTSENSSSSFGLPGDPDLDGLIPGFDTNDASVLEFDFIASGGSISVQYVFGSDEYNEYVGASFNDVFGFFLDGVNIALVPGSTTPVSINNVNQSQNAQLFKNNSPNDLGIPTPFGIQADGFTVVLTASAGIAPGAHHIKLAIADAGDTIVDSWVFLADQSFVSGDVDLQISGSDSSDPVIVGNRLTYSYVVTNHGPDPASSVLLQDVLPAGATFFSASVSQGTIVLEGGVISAEIGDLASGASATVTIVVTADQLGVLTNTATVEAAQNETAPENNTLTLATSVEPARISIDDLQIIEGNSGTKEAVFTISLNGAENNFTITVAYATGDITTSGGLDYLPRAGVLTFAPGQLSRTIAVPVVGDKSNEVTESFQVQLSAASHAEIVKGTGIATILDNDPLPGFYVDDVQVTTTLAGERVAVFTVALDWPSGRDVSVAYTTADGGAQAGIEYQGTSGVLSFAAGERTKQVIVPVTTSAVYSGNKKFYLNLSGALNAGMVDPQGACTMVYAAEPMGEQTIDNGGPGYSRTYYGWETLTNTMAHQLDYDYHAAGDGNAKAAWTFAALPAGSYQVLTRWIPFSNRATNAPFTILDGNTSLATIPVNQQLAPTGDHSNGIIWQSLGTFQVIDNTLTVRLSDNANGYVVADAVRIVAGGIAPQVPEMDVSAFERSIDTGDTTPSYDDATDFGTATLYTDSIPHTFAISNHANADLLLTGSPRVTISGANAADFQVVMQPAATVGPGKKSNLQLVFHPLGAGVRTAVVSIANSDDSEHPYTFTVQGTTAENSPGVVILDNTMPGFAKFGDWSSNSQSQAYLGEMQSSAAGAGGSVARWQFGGLTAGTYFVYTSWAASPEQATNAPFSVGDGGPGGQTIHLNQQQAPGTFLVGRHWGSLGAITIATGMLTVDLTNGANGAVAADAVMIVRQGAELPAAPLIHNASLPQDVNADGRVSVGDLLIVVNSLLRTATPLTATSSTITSLSYYMDVTNDGRVSASDVLSVVNYLLRQTTAPAATPLLTVASPEATDQALVLLDDTSELPPEDPTSASGMVPISSATVAVPRLAVELQPTFAWLDEEIDGEDEVEETLELLATDL